MFWILGSSRDGSEKPFYEIVFFMIWKSDRRKLL
jgi:hypothetical protein